MLGLAGSETLTPRWPWFTLSRSRVLLRESLFIFHLNGIWNPKVSHGTWVSQGFKPNFADSGEKSTEPNIIMCFVCVFFLPPISPISTNEPSVLYYLKHKERTISFSTYHRSLVNSNHKQRHLHASCWGWEMIFSSFPTHSHFPLGLMEADFSMTILLMLAAPIDCTKQARACQCVASGKAATLTLDLLYAICWLWGSLSCSWQISQRTRWTEHKMCDRDSCSALLAGHLILVLFSLLKPH